MILRLEDAVEAGPTLMRRPLRRKRAGVRSVSVPITGPTSRDVAGRDSNRTALVAVPLRPLIAEYTATFGSTWAPVTRRKHADDFARLIDWIEVHGLPMTTASLDFMTLVDYVTDLRCRPKVSGVWRGAPMRSRDPYIRVRYRRSRPTA